MGNKSTNNHKNETIRGKQPTKYTFVGEYFDLIIDYNRFGGYSDNLTDWEFDMIFVNMKKNGVINPPVKRSELRALADFIYKVLENN